MVNGGSQPLSGEVIGFLLSQLDYSRMRHGILEGISDTVAEELAGRNLKDVSTDRLLHFRLDLMRQAKSEHEWQVGCLYAITELFRGEQVRSSQGQDPVEGFAAGDVLAPQGATAPPGGSLDEQGQSNSPLGLESLRETLKRYFGLRVIDPP